MRGVVIGVGHDDRADDAAGPAVARMVASHLPDGWHAIEHHGDLTALSDLWQGMEEAVIVDAVVSGAPVGTIHHVDLLAEPPSRLAAAGSSHGIGLLEAVDLARTLGRLPGRLTLVGVEALQAAVGAPMSLEVQCHLPVAAALVLEQALA
ncbi:MAG TPA: hydrogenase maturation protease [Gemmatimonadales bacterium]|nr:hydrogenase maturation protease [Gemmatimonadales bacterium]